MIIVSPFRCTAKILRWIDGDTVDVEAHHKYHPWPDITASSIREFRLRLAIIDTPERGKYGYTEATRRAISLAPSGLTTDIILYGMEKSGPRWLADVLISPHMTTTVSSVLLEEGLAKVWEKK